MIPIHTSHFKLLYRNLLYTGITRGKKLVVLVGTKKALAIATHNEEVKKRHTGLKEAISNFLGNRSAWRCVLKRGRFDAESGVGGQHHALALDTHEGGGLQVGDDDHFAPMSV